jgi:hypothetical protein
MTNEEFERLRQLFGDDFRRWPAPYRQQAFNRTADEAGRLPDEDAALDRLVLEAALMESGEQDLTRKVLDRLGEKERRGASFLSLLLVKPSAVAASAAVLLLVLAVGGYQAARLQGDSWDIELLALASGAGILGDELPSPGGTEIEGEGSL